MAYTMEWHIPKRVLLVTYYDEITIDDLSRVNAEFSQYIAEGEAPIHLVTYLQTAKYPTSLKTMRDVLSMLKHSEWGWFLVVGIEDSLAQFLVQLVGNVFKLQTRVVASLEEADIALQKLDITLTKIMQPE